MKPQLTHQYQGLSCKVLMIITCIIAPIHQAHASLGDILQTLLQTVIEQSAMLEKEQNTITHNQANNENDSQADDDRDFICIATEGAYPPFNSVDSEGNLVGFDVDLSNALCADMQIKCEIVSQEWDGIIPGLKAKKYDAIIAGMAITKERKRVIDFSEPYFVSSMTYVGRKNHVTNALNPVKIIGVQSHTEAHDYLIKHESDSTIITSDNSDDVYKNLQQGKIQFAFADIAVSYNFLKNNADKFEHKGDAIPSDDTMGIAVRKNDPLKQKFNVALQHIRDNGTYQKIYDKYFGR